MSYKALNWAWEAELPTSQKFVLVALADMADENESCFPGQERLARMVGGSVSTVRRAVKALEASGHISRQQRRGKDGMRTSDRYRLRVNHSIRPVVVTGQSEQGHRSNDAVLTGHGEGVTPREPLEEPPVSLSPDESDDLGTLIPDDWRPNLKHLDKAASLRLDVKNEYQRFRSHAERNRRRLKNWNAGFTNWLKQGAVMAQQRQGQPAPQTFARQRQDNSLAIFEHYKNQEESHAEVRDSEAADVQALDRGR